jgi:hypothetical protein
MPPHPRFAPANGQPGHSHRCRAIRDGIGLEHTGAVRGAGASLPCGSGAVRADASDDPSIATPPPGSAVRMVLPRAARSSPARQNDRVASRRPPLGRAGHLGCTVTLDRQERKSPMKLNLGALTSHDESVHFYLKPHKFYCGSLCIFRCISWNILHRLSAISPQAYPQGGARPQANGSAAEPRSLTCPKCPR